MLIKSTARCTQWGLFLLSVILACATPRSGLATEAHDVNLNSGIRGIASLGDSESQIQQRNKHLPAKTTVKEEPGLERLKFTHFYYIQEMGARVYFRNGRVELIAIQEPFRGAVQGTSLRVFSLTALPEGKKWDSVLTRELGGPSSRASGGRFGSEALFYAWGDISFNRSGPNEIAIYREQDISRYRQKNFGRDITFFKKP